MYGKIYKSIYYGSLAPQRSARELMIFLCVHADRHGLVDMTPDSCRKILEWDESEFALAMKVLTSPDPDSASRREEGRRILCGTFSSRGIKLVNYADYRRMQTAEDKKEYQREYYMDKIRPSRKMGRDNKSTPVNISQPASTDSRQAEADVEAEVEKNAEVSLVVEPLFSVSEPTNLSASAMRNGGRGVKRKALENGDSLPEGEITADQAFAEIFWPEYPRKKDREDALKAWKSLKLKDDDEETIKAIMAALRRDVKEEWRDRGADKIPYPAHWLRKKGWLD